MGFTKLDNGLVQSSLLLEGPETFMIFIVLLSCCDSHGLARVSSIYLSSVCHLPIETVDQSLKRLESPDPRSRSKNDDGARIKEVDGGFQVINYPKYRAWSYSNDPEAIRKRRERTMSENKDNVQNIGTVTDNVREPTDILPSASSSLSSSSGREEETSEEAARRNALRVAFSDAGLASILSPGLLKYLTSLWEEYQDRVDFLSETKKKLAHLVGMSGKMKSNPNFPLQFRNWMNIAVEIAARKVQEEEKGSDESYRDQFRLMAARERIKDDVIERHRDEIEALKAKNDQLGLSNLAFQMENEAKAEFKAFKEKIT